MIFGILIYILISPAFAGTMEVAFDDKSYKVESEKDFISFNEYGFSKKIKKQKCNQDLMDQFAADLKANKTNLIEMKKGSMPKGAIKVSFDGATKLALRFGSEGQYFVDLPSKFKTLWLTSERICKR